MSEAELSPEEIALALDRSDTRDDVQPPSPPMPPAYNPLEVAAETEANRPGMAQPMQQPRMQQMAPMAEAYAPTPQAPLPGGDVQDETQLPPAQLQARMRAANIQAQQAIG